MRSYQVAYKRLLQFWDYNQPATTLMRVRAFLRKYPDAHFVWMRLGNLLTDLARYEEAREALSREIALYDPSTVPHPLLYVWMGDSYRQGGNRPAAENWYRRAIEADPHNPEGYAALGKSLLQRGHPAEAQTVLLQGTQCEKPLAEAWYWLGLVHRAQSQYLKAAKCLNRAIAIESDYPQARHALTDVRKVIRRWEWDPPKGLSSGEAYEHMEELRADNNPAHNALLARDYLAKCPQNMAVWVSLGQELRRLYRYPKARRALQISMRWRQRDGKPPWYVAHYQMGKLHRKSGEYNKAYDWHTRAIYAAPNDAGPWILRGALLAVWGRFEEAKAAHRRATFCEKGCRDEAWYNIGLILRAQERFSDSATCFKRALAIDPDYKIAKRALRDVTAARAWERREMKEA